MSPAVAQYQEGLEQLLLPQPDAFHDYETEISLDTSIQVAPSKAEPDEKSVIRQEKNLERVYTDRDMLQVRNSLKWCSKLWRDSHKGWGPESRLQFSSHTTEVGYLLALAKEKTNLIITGMLYNALDEHVQKSDPTPTGKKIIHDRLETTIERKFGSKILKNIHLLHQGLGDLFEMGISPKKKSNIATISCAIESARKAAQLKPLDQTTTVREKHGLYRKLGVPQTLLSQFEIEHGLNSGASPEGTGAWSVREVIHIRNALRLSFWHFKDATRKWGPLERLPLSTHASEVGLMAIMAGCESPVIAAAPLHDILEPYVTDVSVDSLRIRIGRLFDDTLGDGTHLATSVLSLIDGVTEPPRIVDQSSKKEENQSWHNRKRAVLDHLRLGDSQMAALACAAKTSTLAAGNKMLYLGKKVSDWSSGSAKENTTHFIEHAELYHEKHVPESLLSQYEMELSRFILLSRYSD